MYGDVHDDELRKIGCFDGRFIRSGTDKLFWVQDGEVFSVLGRRAIQVGLYVGSEAVGFDGQVIFTVAGAARPVPV